MDSLPFVFACSSITTLWAIWLFRPLAYRFDLIDRPDTRKQHAGDIPLVGGLAIFAGVLVAVLVSVPMGSYLLGPLIASTLIVATGTFDDSKRLGVGARLVLQSAAALIMIWSTGLTIHSLGNLLGFGVINLGVFAIPFTVVAVVGAINAFNMIDGIDGLAGSVSMIALLVLASILGGGGSGEMVLIVSLAAAALSFTLFNLGVFGRSRKVFLGDAGSMLIGFALCWLLVMMTQGPRASLSPAAALWVIALPLIDMWAVMGQRIAGRLSPFESRRDHFHHILLAAGFNDRAALGILAALALTFGLSAVLSSTLGIPEVVTFVTFLAALVVRTAFIVKPQAPSHRIWRLSRNVPVSSASRRARKDARSSAGEGRA